jgi:SNF2 family DNA or RNA helicase
MRLIRINRCHPLTLTTETETRKLMHEYLMGGVYTIEPAAKVAIAEALREVASLACPLRPVTELEVVAYADEEERLMCRAVDPRGKIQMTVGKQYEVRTDTYEFTEYYSRIKPHYDEETGKTTIRDHDCQLSGVDRYIEITDDRHLIHRFMDRPDKSTHYHHPETMLWNLFERPYVPTVAEVQVDDYNKNLQSMAFNEMIAGFTYFPGQLDYYARMACKNYGLVAADVGTGKSLGALTLINLKSPKRALLIAPQGTMRSVGEEDEIDYQASQWVTEIQRFAPGEPVFQLFSAEDWQNILRANGGELPPGIYITYPQAYFTNGGFESLPTSWDKIEEKRFCERFNLKFDEKRGLDACYHRNVGASNKHGIKCIAEPCLNTRIAAVHGEPWEMVIIDEAHLCCNLNAQVTQNLIRLQPKYRFALTATPIPNIITNIFSLMGWLCVPNWYKGKIRNAAWPYAVDECGRFTSTFLSEETDLTAQEQARKAGKKGWRRVGVRPSPIISSPARLLKLLKPTMAYISKEDCNPAVVGCEVIDVRVALGKEQEKLYAFWLNRANYYPQYKSPLTIAQVQSTRLRGICAAPASLDYSRDCKSNFNPKMVTILQLIRDCLGKGEQVVVVAARVDQSDALAVKLSEAGVPISRIDSSISADLHTAEANRFKKGDSRVMLMGIKCAQGHSFDRCPNLIIASLEWSYGTLHQAKGRVWRLTSPKAVKIWCVLHKNTIEELLFDRVAVKQDAATLCLHGKRVPRDFTTMDASEVLAEHIVNYSAKDGEVLSESECETQWQVLKQQLVMANRPVRKAA